MKKQYFFDLTEEHYKKLERFALHLTRDSDLAKDVVSDTVVAAYD